MTVRAKATVGLPGWRAERWVDVEDSGDLQDLIAAGFVTTVGAPETLPPRGCCGHG